MPSRHCSRCCPHRCPLPPLPPPLQPPPPPSPSPRFLRLVLSLHGPLTLCPIKLSCFRPCFHFSTESFLWLRPTRLLGEFPRERSIQRAIFTAISFFQVINRFRHKVLERLHHVRSLGKKASSITAQMRNTWLVIVIPVQTLSLSQYHRQERILTQLSKGGNSIIHELMFKSKLNEKNIQSLRARIINGFGIQKDSRINSTRCSEMAALSDKVESKLSHKNISTFQV